VPAVLEYIPYRKNDGTAGAADRKDVLIRFLCRHRQRAPTLWEV
jgi:hypothetical protein